MDCGICHVAFSSRGQPTCASCARALVYKARLNHLTEVLARESCHVKVDAVVSSPSGSRSASLTPDANHVLVTDSAASHRHALVLGQIAAAEAHHDLVDQQVSHLKKQIHDARLSQASRRADHERRQAEIAAEKHLLKERRGRLLQPLQTSITHLSRKLDKIHNRTREGRVKLCHETARLAGLQQRRRQANSGQMVEEYTIGGVPIPDLRSLCVARPDQVTAALANICRLLTTTCHYLSVRLPAEITPPHANYPHPTIFSVQSSYQAFQLPFPASSTSHTSHATPNALSASRLLEHRSLPKLRLLHLDRPLVRLAKDDAAVYNLFVEGVTLLAWDVAWLCRSQGLSIANSWDEVCALGRNLCLLFRGHAAVGDHAQSLVGEELAIPAPTFGELSHAAIRTNIDAPVGIAHMRSWRFTSPHRLIDTLKSHLLTEMSGAEWELLDESEWEAREDEQAVLVGGTRTDSTPADKSASTDKGKSSSGWTKVKSRTDAA